MITAKDENGKIIYEGEAHSFLKNFMQTLYTIWSGPSTSVVDTSNVAQTIPTPAASSPVSKGYGQINAFQLGTGTNPVTPTDHVIQTLIANGSGVGQLAYGAITVAPVTVNGNVIEIDITLSVTNNSGGPITIRETALQGSYIRNDGLSSNVIWDRTLVAIPIANAQTLTIQYSITVSV